MKSPTERDKAEWLHIMHQGCWTEGAAERFLRFPAEEIGETVFGARLAAREYLKEIKGGCNVQAQA